MQWRVAFVNAKLRHLLLALHAYDVQAGVGKSTVYDHNTLYCSSLIPSRVSHFFILASQSASSLGSITYILGQASVPDRKRK